MGNSWYKKSMPKLKIVKASIEQIGKICYNTYQIWGGTTSAWSGKHAVNRTFSYQQIHAKKHRS